MLRIGLVLFNVFINILVEAGFISYCLDSGGGICGFPSLIISTLISTFLPIYFKLKNKISWVDAIVIFLGGNFIYLVQFLSSIIIYLK